MICKLENTQTNMQRGFSFCLTTDDLIDSFNFDLALMKKLMISPRKTYFQFFKNFLVSSDKQSVSALDVQHGRSDLCKINNRSIAEKTIYCVINNV